MIWSNHCKKWKRNRWFIEEFFDVLLSQCCNYIDQNRIFIKIKMKENVVNWITKYAFDKCFPNEKKNSINVSFKNIDT